MGWWRLETEFVIREIDFEDFFAMHYRFHYVQSHRYQLSGFCDYEGK